MQRKEPLQPHDVPSRPWAKVAVDFFHLNGQQYLLIVDYFSGFWEVEILTIKLVERCYQENEDALCTLHGTASPTWLSQIMAHNLLRRSCNASAKPGSFS